MAVVDQSAGKDLHLAQSLIVLGLVDLAKEPVPDEVFDPAVEKQTDAAVGRNHLAIAPDERTFALFGSGF